MELQDHLISGRLQLTCAVNYPHMGAGWGTGDPLRGGRRQHGEGVASLGGGES